MNDRIQKNRKGTHKILFSSNQNEIKSCWSQPPTNASAFMTVISNLYILCKSIQNVWRLRHREMFRACHCHEILYIQTAIYIVVGVPQLEWVYSQLPEFYRVLQMQKLAMANVKRRKSFIFIQFQLTVICMDHIQFLFFGIFFRFGTWLVISLLPTANRWPRMRCNWKKKKWNATESSIIWWAAAAAADAFC